MELCGHLAALPCKFQVALLIAECCGKSLSTLAGDDPEWFAAIALSPPQALGPAISSRNPGRLRSEQPWKFTWFEVCLGFQHSRLFHHPDRQLCREGAEEWPEPRRQWKVSQTTERRGKTWHFFIEICGFWLFWSSQRDQLVFGLTQETRWTRPEQTKNATQVGLVPYRQSCFCAWNTPTPLSEWWPRVEFFWNDGFPCLCAASLICSSAKEGHGLSIVLPTYPTVSYHTPGGFDWQKPTWDASTVNLFTFIDYIISNVIFNIVIIHICFTSIVHHFFNNDIYINRLIINIIIKININIYSNIVMNNNFWIIMFWRHHLWHDHLRQLHPQQWS